MITTDKPSFVLPPVPSTWPWFSNSSTGHRVGLHLLWRLSPHKQLPWCIFCKNLKQNKIVHLLLVCFGPGILVPTLYWLGSWSLPESKNRPWNQALIGHSLSPFCVPDPRLRKEMILALWELVYVSKSQLLTLYVCMRDSEVFLKVDLWRVLCPIFKEPTDGSNDSPF